VAFGNKLWLHRVRYFISTSDVIFVDFELYEVKEVLQHDLVMANFGFVLQKLCSNPLFSFILHFWVGNNQLPMIYQLSATGV